MEMMNTFFLIIYLFINEHIFMKNVDMDSDR